MRRRNLPERRHCQGGELPWALRGMVLVRDSKMAPHPGCEGPGGPELSFSTGQWEAFITTIKGASSE